MRVLVVGALGIVLLAGAVRADEVPVTHVLSREAHQMGGQLKLKLSVFEVSDEAPTPVDEWGLKVDILHQRARLRLDGGDGLVLGFKLDASLRLDENGDPRVHGRLDLSAAGRTLSIAIPEVKLVPRFDGGEMHVEYTLPLLEGKF